MATRIEHLSTPKRDHLRNEDLRSVYWRETSSSSLTSASALTERQRVLSSAKTLAATYEHPRQADLRSASSRHASPRLESLAKPKALPTQYEGARELRTAPPSTAMNAQASPRVLLLSRPRPRPRRHRQDRSLPPLPLPITSVPDKALVFKPSPRLENLSMPKDASPYWDLPKDVRWHPSLTALKATPSDRINQLSIAKQRIDKDADYDPYMITTNALMGRSSTRIQELCLPMDRKQRQKIIVLKKKK